MKKKVIIIIIIIIIIYKLNVIWKSWLKMLSLIIQISLILKINPAAIAAHNINFSI
jgi:hypothetical protein